MTTPAIITLTGGALVIDKDLSIIGPGARAGVLGEIAAGAPVGTLLTPVQGPEAARKRWISR